VIKPIEELTAGEQICGHTILSIEQVDGKYQVQCKGVRYTYLPKQPVVVGTKKKNPPTRAKVFPFKQRSDVVAKPADELKTQGQGEPWPTIQNSPEHFNNED